jgi:hypothetical protein
MRLLCLVVPFLCSCGRDLTAWKGAWSGSAVINTGRLPMAISGTLNVTEPGRFEVVSAPTGMPAQVFSCALTASKTTDSTVEFTLPATCDLVAVPAGDCTFVATVNSVVATRAGNAVSATVNGNLKSTCTMGSSTATDFSMTLDGKR